MQSQGSVKGLSRALLQGKKPASPSASSTTLSSPYICTCVGVQRHEIDQHLELQAKTRDTSWSAMTRLEDLQRSLHCGTECGSCVPQLKRIIENSPSFASVSLPQD